MLNIYIICIFLNNYIKNKKNKREAFNLSI